MTVAEDVRGIRQKENEGSGEDSGPKCANLINDDFFPRLIYQQRNLLLFSLLIETATIIWFLYFQFGYQLENIFCYRHFIWFHLKCNDPPNFIFCHSLCFTFSQRLISEMNAEVCSDLILEIILLFS